MRKETVLKKAEALLLILLTAVILLTGCGSQNRSSGQPQQEDEEDTSQEQSNTVTIKNAAFGDISFTIPDNKNVTVTVAKPEQESLEIYKDKLFGETINDNLLQYQKAHIAGDGFNIVMGYIDYRDQFWYKTYDMFKNGLRVLEDVQYGGVDGYCTKYGLLQLSFPSITQFAGRVIAIYPQDLEDQEDLRTGCIKAFELPVVKEILASLMFTGQPLVEERFETATINDPFFSITPTDGWELHHVNEVSHHYVFLKDHQYNPEFSLIVYEYTSPKEAIDDYLGNERASGVRQLENMSINSHEYCVVYRDDWQAYFLFTSPGELDLNSRDTILVSIVFIESLDNAMPLLNTIIIR